MKINFDPLQEKCHPYFPEEASLIQQYSHMSVELMETSSKKESVTDGEEAKEVQIVTQLKLTNNTVTIFFPFLFHIIAFLNL